MRFTTPRPVGPRQFAQCFLGNFPATTGARLYSTPSQSHPQSSTDDPLAPRTIFSGIQPTGVPHLGNYFGALLQWLRLQNSLKDGDRLFISIVDLHALTSLASDSSITSSTSKHSTQVEPLRIAKRRLLATLLAVGLNPSTTTLFYQGDVPEHAELHWILSCNAPVGSLMRMTQWKSKMLERYPHIKSEDDAAREAFFNDGDANKDAKGLKLGLFSYPVLQAADILLYRTTHVPVGEDQIQHIEYARNEAVRFNSRFPRERQHNDLEANECLISPKALISPFRRVMSLTDPAQKMSKSAPSEKSRILLSDEPATIRNRIISAMTDSIQGPITYNTTKRPGVSNLIRILAHARESRTDKVLTTTQQESEDMINDLVSQELSTLTLKALKELIADEVETLVAPIRDEHRRLTEESDGKTLDDIAADGAEKARRLARQTMNEVKEAIEM